MLYPVWHLAYGPWGTRAPYVSPNRPSPPRAPPPSILPRPSLPAALPPSSWTMTFVNPKLTRQTLRFTTCFCISVQAQRRAAHHPLRHADPTCPASHLQDHLDLPLRRHLAETVKAGGDRETEEPLEACVVSFFSRLPRPSRPGADLISSLVVYSTVCRSQQHRS